MIFFNGYPFSILVAITFHSLVLVALLYFQGDRQAEALEFIQPTVIKALTIAENPQIKNAELQERKRLERLDQQRVAQQREAEQKRQADAEAQRKLQEEAARRKEQETKAANDKQEQDKRREEERKREQEKQEQEKREREQQQQQQQQIESQRQADAAAAASAAELAASEFEMVQSATGIIQQYVQGSWSRPPSARNGMRADLQIRLLPTGEVTDVTIVRSSGDAAFDRAAETAVYRAAPFRELQGLPARVFNQNFRVLTLVFQPEDLLN